MIVQKEYAYHQRELSHMVSLKVPPIFAKKSKTIGERKKVIQSINVQETNFATKSYHALCCAALNFRASHALKAALPC